MPLQTKNSFLNSSQVTNIPPLDGHLILSITDQDGTLIYSNKSFSKVLNVSNATCTAMAHQWLKSIIQSETVFCDVLKTIEAGKTWRGVLSQKGSSSNINWLDTCITPQVNNKGTIVKYQIDSKDITDYYRNEIPNIISFKKDLEPLNHLTKNVLYINKFGKIINSSKHNLNTYNDSVIGSNLFDYINPIHHALLSKQISKVFIEGKRCKYEFKDLSPEGQQFVFTSQIRPVFNLQNEVIYATLKSKRHKKRAKPSNEVKAIETKYSNIFQSINVGIIVVANSVGNIIEWNRGAELAFGYTSAEIIGEPLTVLMSKKQVDTGIKEILKVKDKLDNNQYGDNIELCALRKNGEEFPVEFAISHWHNGKEKFYCAFMLDITNRKKLQQKLKKTTKDLELFLYRSAHDLKAPLTSVEGLLQLLKEEKLSETAVMLVSMLEETLEKGRLLLDNMSFASIVSEKRRAITSINFEQQITNILFLLRGIENFDDIKFNIEVETDTDFYFNQELIDSILQNIIQNAICFSKPKTKTHTPTVHIMVKSVNKEISISVVDNGVGIKKDHMDQIFELYFRGSNENTKGTGLGLYIIKRIVDDFNGEVVVSSHLKTGTSIEVRLPNLT